MQWSRSFLHVQINRGFDSRRRCFLFLCNVFFPCLVYFFKHYFSFWPFFLYSYCRPCWSCTSINIYFKLKSGVLFWKRDFKTLDLHTGQAYDQIKTISCQHMSLLWNSWIFFNVSWHHDKQTLYTTNCTNLQPTPTSDPPAKVKLAFCTSSILLILIYILLIINIITLKSQLSLPPRNNKTKPFI